MSRNHVPAASRVSADFCGPVSKDDGQRTTELLELDMDQSLSLRGPNGFANLEEDEQVRGKEFSEETL